MSDTLYELETRFTANTTQLDSKMNSLGGSLTNRMGSIGRGAGSAFSTAFTVGATAGLALLAGGGLFGRWAVNMASDAEEAGSKFGFVFGDAAASVGGKLDEFAAAAGRSRFEMRAMAGDVGAILGPMGLSSQKTGEMSEQLVKLSSDLASFFNASDADAMAALQAGMIGEAEPLRKFGITISAAKVETEALTLGLIKNKNEMTAAAKAQATMSIIMRETAIAQGDAVRTSGSYANVMRGLSGAVTDAATVTGRLLLPAFTEIGKFLRTNVASIDQHAGTFEKWGVTIGEITGNVLRHVGSMQSVVSEFFGGAITSMISTATGGWATSLTEFIDKSLAVSSVLTNDWQATWELIKGVGVAAFWTWSAGVTETIQKVRAYFEGFFGGISGVAKLAFDGIGASMEAWGLDSAAIFSGLNSAFNAVIDKMASRFTWFAKLAGGQAAQLAIQFAEAYAKGDGGVSGDIQSAFNTGRDAIANSEQATQLKAEASALIASVGDSFKTGFKTAFDTSMGRKDWLGNAVVAGNAKKDEALSNVQMLWDAASSKMDARREENKPQTITNSPSPAGSAKPEKPKSNFRLTDLLTGIGGFSQGSLQVAAAMNVPVPAKVDPGQVSFSDTAGLARKFQESIGGETVQDKVGKTNGLVEAIVNAMPGFKKELIDALKGISTGFGG